MLDEFLRGGGEVLDLDSGDGVPVVKRRQKWDKQGKLIAWIKKALQKYENILQLQHEVL